MPSSQTDASGRRQGSIDVLPSGARRVRVYASVDPVTKKRHNLVEIIPPGPQADRRARAARDRLVSQVEEKRNPRTSATVDQLLERYLDQFDGADSTKTLYAGYVRKHISPYLGRLRWARWMQTCSTPSTPSCAAAATTAPADRWCSTGRRASTSATTGAARTGAAL